MHLSFGQLSIEHFALFTTRQVVDLSAGPGLFYVRGINRAEPRLGANDVGKSTIWRALLYCLYGQASASLKATDIRPWDAKGKTLVSLEVFNDGKKYLVARGARPIDLTIDGETAGQEQLEKLGLTFETFTNTILLSQGTDLFLDLPPRDKMRLFSDVLGLERWEARSRFATQTAAALGKDHASWLGELAGLASTRDELKALEDKARGDAEAWESTRQEVLARADKEIASLEREAAGVQRVVDEAALSMDGAGAEAKAIRSKLGQLQAELLEHQREGARVDGKREMIASRIASIADELKKVARGKPCPTCGQNIVGDVEKHRSKLTDERRRLLEQADELKDYTKAHDHAALVEREAEARAHLSEFTEREDRARDVLTSARPRLSGFLNKIDLLKRQRETYRTDDNPHQAQTRELKKRRAKIEADIGGLEQDADKLVQRIERTQFWAKAFKELQLHIIDEALGELEMVTNAILPEMGLEDWSIEYAVDRETKSGTIKSELNAAVLSPYNDKPVRWESWGGGASQRLRIAASLALSEVLLNRAGVTTDVEILDEPARFISVEGRDDLIDMLADRAAKLEKTIFFVEHQVIESARFAGTVTVTKTKAGSVIN